MKTLHEEKKENSESPSKFSSFSETTECYSCKHMRTILGDPRIACSNPPQHMQGHNTGVFYGWQHSTSPVAKELIAFKISKWAKKIREEKETPSTMIDSAGLYGITGDNNNTFTVRIISINQNLAIGWMTTHFLGEFEWAGIWDCRNGRCYSLWGRKGLKVEDTLSNYNIFKKR